MRSKAIHLAAAAAIISLSVSACAQRGGGSSDSSAAESFPSKDLTFVVQAGAGGGSDLTSRTLAKEMESDLGRSIVVENRTGGAGRVGMGYLKGRPADGYTLGFLPVEVAMLGHQGADLKPQDFTILGQVMNAPATLSVPEKSPYKTFEEFIAAAKSKPLTVSNSGAGSIWEAATLARADETGAQFKPVPYDGGAPAVAAGVAGEVDAVMAGVGESGAAAKDGRLRLLAVMAPERVATQPDVPTGKELGVDLVIGGWGMIGAPANLPDGVRDRLVQAVSKAANTQAFKDVMTKAGNTPMAKTPEEAKTFAESEYARFGEILK